MCFASLVVGNSIWNLSPVLKTINWSNTNLVVKFLLTYWKRSCLSLVGNPVDLWPGVIFWPRLRIGWQETNNPGFFKTLNHINQFSWIREQGGRRLLATYLYLLQLCKANRCPQYVMATLRHLNSYPPPHSATHIFLETSSPLFDLTVQDLNSDLPK